MDNTNTRSDEINAIKPLLKKVQNLRILTSEEEIDLITKAQAGCKVSLDKMVQHNLRFAVKKAKYFMNRGIPLEDLLQEASIGLHLAVLKFDVNRLTDKGKPYKFSTYASWWIDQPLHRAMGKKSRIVRVPDKELSHSVALQRIYQHLIESRSDDGLFGTKPTSEELVEEFNRHPELVAKFGLLTVTKAKELGRILNGHKPIYLDEPVGEEKDLCLVDYLMDENLLPEEKAESTADKEYVRKLLTSLTKADSDFIMLKYGFVDHQSRTDRQMAMLLKIPIKEVKAREARIMEILKEKSSMDHVNTEILCNVVIVSPGPNYYELFDTVMNISGLSHTQTRCMLKDFPVTAFSRRSQHMAEILSSQLEDAGASVTITVSQ